MSRWEDAAADLLAAELSQELGEVVVSARTCAGDLVLEVGREDLARVATLLRGRFRYSSLIDLCGSDQLAGPGASGDQETVAHAASDPAREQCLAVVYQLYSFRENRRVRLKVATDGESPVPSVTGIWRGAAWAEREVHEMFGVRFSEHPGLFPLLLWDGFAGYPLRKDFPLAGVGAGVAALPPSSGVAASDQGAGEEVVLSFGPRRPALGGVLRLRLLLEGDLGGPIGSCQPLPGYLHRGVEKLMEAASYLENLPHTDRLDFSAAATTNLAYAGAVEKLLGLEVPPRARFLRTLFAELQRVASHLWWLANHALDLGATAPSFTILRLRDRVLDLFESYCGARLTLSCIRPGGLPHDLPPGWLGACRDWAESFPAQLEACVGPLAADPGWRERTVGLGVLEAETAIDFGVSGPMLRASGVDWDLRRASPYDAYGELDFEVAVGRRGDAFDRFEVRVAEMRQARRLVLQCLDRLPGGPVLAGEAAGGSLPAPAAGPGASAGRPGPPAEVYHGVEGPRGEVGFYLVAGESGRPHRCHVRAPSFYNLQAFPEMARGHGVGDLVALVSSADIALGEVDR